MDRVYGFMTKDNKFFSSEKEALQHEALLDFINWYKKNNELKVNTKQMVQ